MKSIAIRSAILAVAAAVLPAAAEITWITTPDEAYAKAAETGKPVMIEFTGSDWCGFWTRNIILIKRNWQMKFILCTPN